MRLSPHFMKAEFEVSAAFPHLVEPIPPALLANIQRLVTGVIEPWRVAVGRKFLILSGYRGERLNRAVKGSPTSQHRFAQAADVTTSSLLQALKTLMRNPPKDLGQCIYYPKKNFIHAALVSAKYLHPTFCIHDPSRGWNYKQVQSWDELATLIKLEER